MPKKKEFNYSRDDLDRLIVDIFNGTVSPERLPVDLYNATFDRLLDGVFRGFGNTLDELNDGTPEKLLLEYYQHNIAIFSGAKTFQQVNDMSNAVFTPDGYKRSFSDFKKLITGDNFHNGIFAQYNVNYLQTEYNTAVRVAQMGRQFTEYYKDADLFPYLKYITVHDERVRDTHKYFDGVTLPVGHKFWDTHCPPNGFNCRCRVIQLSEFDDFTITPDADVKNLPDPDQPLFGMNPAKSGFVFDPSKHPYTVKIGERFAPASKVNFGLPTPPAPTIPITIPDLPEKSVQTVADAENFDQMENYLKRKFGIQEINIRKLNFEIAKEQMIQFEKLADEYNIPDLVAIKDTENGKNVFASVSRFGLSPEAQLDFNPNFYKKNRRGKYSYFELDDPDILKEQIFRTTNHFVDVDPGNEKIRIITHEFGHIFGSIRQTGINSTISNPKFDTRRKAFKEIKTIFSNYKKDLNEIELKKIKGELTMDQYLNLRRERFISRYGETSIDEFFAETFAMSKLNSNASIYAKQVLEVVNKYFKK